MVNVDKGLELFALWNVGFGLATTILWLARRGKEGRGRLSVYPFAVIFRLGVAMKPSPSSRLARRTSWVFVALMLAAMAFFYTNIFYFVYRNYFAPSEERVAPLSPLIPGVTIAWRDVPLVLVAIGIGVLVHEAAHAITARIEGVGVKNAGLALIAFIPAAFVEVDEKKMAEAPLSVKAKVYSAGVAVNLLLALLVAPLLGHFSSGALVLRVEPGSPADVAGLMPGDVIVKVNDVPVRDVKSLSDALIALGFNEAEKKVEFTLTVLRDGRELVLNVVKPPNYNKLGVEVIVKLSGPGPLLYSVHMINLALALINAAPLFVTDGGQLVRDFMLHVAGRRGLALSAGLQASTLILVLSLTGFNKIIIPH
ncbi:site-2 protease family protein [Stetteria hydrogenophila]